VYGIVRSRSPTILFYPFSMNGETDSHRLTVADLFPSRSIGVLLRSACHVARLSSAEDGSRAVAEHSRAPMSYDEKKRCSQAKYRREEKTKKMSVFE
jgi:hypothetical protein